MKRPRLSVIIPTWNEARSLPRLLRDLRRSGRRHFEVIVVDGGSTDGTVEVARRAGVRVLQAERGRGRQLRAGAAAAHARWLWFLHADVRLRGRRSPRPVVPNPEGTDPRVAWYSPLRIAAKGVKYRVVEAGANLRSRWLHLPYGDQGLLVHRDLYDAAGGYDDVPLMEDVILARRIARWGRLRELRVARVKVSPRRWQRDGVLRRTLRNQGILLRWLLGTSPERLAERYR